MVAYYDYVDSLCLLVFCSQLFQGQYKTTGRIVAGQPGDIASESAAEEGGDHTKFAAGATEPEDERDRGTDEDLGRAEDRRLKDR